MFCYTASAKIYLTVQGTGKGKEATMKYLEIMQYLQSFDEAPQETQRLAIRLAVLIYRSSDLAITKHFADNYKS